MGNSTGNGQADAPQQHADLTGENNQHNGNVQLT